MIYRSKPIQTKLPENAWLIVFLLFWVGALNYLDRNTIATMRSSIIESIPMTDAQFGMMTTDDIFNDVVKYNFVGLKPYRQFSVQVTLINAVSRTS